ncbi:MAG: hypothetical protein SPI59_06195 [Finegoldia sp.]|nr:hypothetical protein [Finegoldia sp.]
MKNKKLPFLLLAGLLILGVPAVSKEQAEGYTGGEVNAGAKTNNPVKIIKRALNNKDKKDEEKTKKSQALKENKDVDKNKTTSNPNKNQKTNIKSSNVKSSSQTKNREINNPSPKKPNPSPQPTKEVESQEEPVVETPIAEDNPSPSVEVSSESSYSEENLMITDEGEVETDTVDSEVSEELENSESDKVERADDDELESYRVHSDIGNNIVVKDNDFISDEDFE